MRAILFILFCVVSACTFDAGLPPSSTNLGNELDASNDADSTTSRDLVADQPRVDSTATDTATDTTTDTGEDTNTDLPPDLPTTAICDGVEKDILTDPDHCGRCRNPCDDEFGECIGGVCACPPGAETCGSANICTATEIDPNNCGQCGRTCGTAQWCVNGACQCRDGYTLCNGVCVDTDSNTQHCGGCNIDCMGDACSGGACRNEAECGLFNGWECKQANAGASCIRGETSEWHCNPGLLDMCGEECQGDEVCYKPSLFVERACYNYRPAIACTECPCAECGPDEQCIVSDVVVGEIFCLEE